MNRGKPEPFNLNRPKKFRLNRGKPVRKNRRFSTSTARKNSGWTGENRSFSTGTVLWFNRKIPGPFPLKSSGVSSPGIFQFNREFSGRFRLFNQSSRFTALQLAFFIGFYSFFLYLHSMTHVGCLYCLFYLCTTLYEFWSHGIQLPKM